MPKLNLLLILLISSRIISQSNHDSLIKEWRNTSRPDSSRMKAYSIDIKENYLKTNPDTALMMARQLFSFAENKRSLDFMALALQLQGSCQIYLNNYSKALEYYHQSIEIFKKTSNKKGLAVSYSNSASVLKNLGDNLQALEYSKKSVSYWEAAKDKDGLMKGLNMTGNIYLNLGQYITAVEYYQNALLLAEQTNNVTMKGLILVNTGNIYYMRKNFSSALDYYKQGIKILEKTADTRNLANAINNVGSVYTEKKQYDSAKIYYRIALRIREKENDIIGESETLNNLGGLFIEIVNPDSAKIYIDKAIVICRKAGQPDALAISLIASGTIATQKKDFDQAKKYLNEALTLSTQSANRRNMAACYQALYKLEKQSGNFTQALAWHEKYTTVADSLLNEESNELLIKTQYQYQFRSKAISDSLKTEEIKKVTAIQLKQEKVQRYALYSGLGLVLIFALFMFNRFKVTQKQKKLIEIQKTEVELQKNIVDIKQKEILDSINYARRLQEAILPAANVWSEQLPDSFILYLPKDIVAGDFYWMHLNEASDSTSELLLFAAADCTGHGVPGSMVSVVCSNALNRSVLEFGLTDPGKILDKTRELVISTFEKSDKDVKDGMDISLCALMTSENPPRKTLLWAGANNPLWLIRNNQVIEYKANKQPIGKYAGTSPFTTHKIVLEKNDLLYLFTDGIADQFGGEKGKKYKYKQLAQLLIDIAELDIQSQKLMIDQSFNKWKNTLEQVDDVLIIGIKI